jgi:hypothetical protein
MHSTPNEFLFGIKSSFGPSDTEWAPSCLSFSSWTVTPAGLGVDHTQVSVQQTTLAQIIEATVASVRRRYILACRVPVLAFIPNRLTARLQSQCSAV